jgi:hypothetical protein
MGLPRVRFPISRLLAVVAAVACAIGAALAFSVEPNTAGNVLAGWGALYGVPVMLILVRGIPLRRAAKIAGTIILFGLPGAGLFGLLGFAVSGYVGLIGGFMLAALMIGWGALLTAGLSGDKAVRPEPELAPTGGRRTMRESGTAGLEVRLSTSGRE